MIRSVTFEETIYNDLPYKFEAGTPNISGVVGLGAAIDYLQQIGLEKIHRYEQMLTRRAHEVLAEIEGVKFLGPSPDQKAGIVSFVVKGVHAHDVAQLMDRQGIAVRAGHHCTMPLHKRLGVSASTRASFYFYNTLDEVEQLATGLRETKRVLRRS